MTTTEVGGLLGLSARTVQRMAERGELPHVRKLPGVNGSYLFDPVVVLRFKSDRDNAKKAS